MNAQTHLIHDLSYPLGQDGPIDLEHEAGYGEAPHVTLLSCHSNHLFEKSDLLLTADELNKRHARQTCETHVALPLAGPALESETPQKDSDLAQAASPAQSLEDDIAKHRRELKPAEAEHRVA